MTSLAGRIALVTGASRGFGRAAAAAFAAEGAHIVALARTTGGLEDLDDEIQGSGGSATLVPLDIADSAALPRLGAALNDRWGRLDLWLHTAVYAAPLQPAEHIAERELERSLAVNVTAFQQLIRVLDPLLRRADGPRALVASDHRAGEKFFGAYGATKAAQSALAQSWAVESGRRITVAEVIPPPMPTAVRGRFYPGEHRERLTHPRAAAARLVAALGEPLEPGTVLRL
ncbi:MAG TPA: SDR family NAD(P)-dependent oxidoreductase [Thermohalobaculum sp.]|nr:SDR family NAD(P)-dependent oxidoreductase [Thermohalobaculum sp.]